MTNFDVLKEKINNLIKKIKKINKDKVIEYIVEKKSTIISFILAVTLSTSVISLDIKTKRPEKKEEQIKEVQEEVVEKEEVKEIVNIDPSLFDSVGESFYLKYYDSYNGGVDTGEKSGYVVEANKDDKKLLVDATDYSKILLDDFDSIGESFYFKYYDKYYGGSDNTNSKSDGYVTDIIIDDKKYLVDANDLSNILLSDYESIGEPFYLKYYDEYYGGLDNTNVKSNGYVVEIVKHGIKYLVDANDFTNILVENYKTISTNDDQIIIEYSDGRIEEKSNTTFTYNKSLVLKNK